MKTRLSWICGNFFSRSHSSIPIILTLVLTVCIWGCSKEGEVLPSLRGSDKTVINTRPTEFVATDSAKLRAEILEIGPTPILEAGFILSQQPEPRFDTDSKLIISEINKTGPYYFVAKKLDANKKYYYRFYVKEKDKVILGSIHDFTTTQISINRVRYAYEAGPDENYEGSSGNMMMITGTNFSKIRSENIVKVGDVIVPVTSVDSYDPKGNGSTVLYFFLPDNIKPGQHEITVTRAGQTVKAPKLLQVLPGQWKKLNDFKAGFVDNWRQYKAKAFAMNGKGYLAGLFNNLPTSLYQYPPGVDDWSKLIIDINSYSFHAAFGLNSKAYISVGFNKQNADPSLNRYEFQLYSLDPSTGTQEKKQSLSLFYSQYVVSPNVTSFAIGDRAYIGGGNYVNYNWSISGTRKDFYKYTPDNDTWTRIADFPGTSTTDAVTFEVDGVGYLLAATKDGNVLAEVWAYNPNNNTWNRKRDFPGQLKYNMAGFTIGSSGYVIGGEGNYYSYMGPIKRDFWKYDSTTDTWQEVANFDGNVGGAKCFVIGSKAYAVVSWSQSNSSVWEFTPSL